MDGQSSACHPLQAHLVLESHFPFRLILYWIRLALAEFFSSDYDGGAEYLILAHLSEQNNHPEIARAAAEQALGGRQGLWHNRVLLATQTEVLEPIRL